MKPSSTNEMKESILIGRNPIMEALKSGKQINSIIISSCKYNAQLDKILATAKELKVPIKTADRKKLDELSNGESHQGIIALTSPRSYSDIDDIFKNASLKNQAPFIIIADKIQDPHNLGSIIRTAECAGAHGIIIQNRRCVAVTQSVEKVSCGACEYIPVARVTNISSTIDELKSRGVWIYGADMDGKIWCEQNLNTPIALVIGSEGNGLSKLVKQKCDSILSIPLIGKINSLNASVAAGILMYEVTRQRNKIKAV